MGALQVKRTEAPLNTGAMVAADSEHRRFALGAMSVDPARRSDAVRGLPRTAMDGLLAFANRNRIAPVLAHALIEHDSRWQDSEWGAIHRASEARMRVVLREVDGVASRLARSGIRLVALKNAGIARGIYPCPACCPMGDADLLVERDRFVEAHALVQECGFAFDSRSSVEPAHLESAVASGGTEYVKRCAGEEVWLELQWRPIAGRWIRRDQEPDGAEMMARSIAIPGTAVRLLSPEDNMLQVALHTAKHSFVRAPGIRLHTDVDRLAALQPPRWGEVAATAARLAVKTATYISLASAVDLLGARVPPEVLVALQPPAWKKGLLNGWLRRVDFFEPDEKKFSRPGMLVFHALLYDDLAGLAASVVDTDPAHLGIRHLPANLARGARRLLDVATRYQR